MPGMFEFAGGSVAVQTSRAVVAVSQDEGSGLALGQGEVIMNNTSTFGDIQGDAGQQGQGLPAAAHHYAAAGTTGQGTEFGRGAGVVGPGLEIAAQGHLPGEAGNDAVDFVVGFRGRFRDAVFGDGHEVGDANHAAVYRKGRVQYVSVGLVLLQGFKNGPGRGDTKAPADFLVQNRRENAGGVEAREAAPVHGAVGPD